MARSRKPSATELGASFGVVGGVPLRNISRLGATRRCARLVTGIIVCAALLSGALVGQSAGQSRLRPVHLARSPGSAVASSSGHRRPNIVFVLTDDLSMDLLPYMPQVQALRSRGESFSDYFVSDSLCCPSRSSIFTGDFPHDTGVFTNVGSDGGIGAFYAHGDQNRAFNVVLQAAGYRTAMMGKYLNGYLQGPTRSPVPDTYVPPGWSQWDVAGFAYPEFDYELNQDGSLHHYGRAPRAYLTDVLARKGTQFVDHSMEQHRPFFIELATFAPHAPYTPAPRDAGSFPGLKAPRPKSFNVMPRNAPSWLADHPRLGPTKQARLNRAFRRRVQSVQAVDAMLARIQRALKRHGQLGNTYIVFSSDNGYHTGEYRLMPGKLTAFDTDIRVPLIVAGPEIKAGTRSPAMTENVDLAKTFEAMAGTSSPSDGHSLMSLLEAPKPRHWRTAILVEHHGPDMDATADPDAQPAISGNPTTYEAMRTKRFLYVEYRDGEREYYDLGRDPRELNNIAGTLTAAELGRLHEQLTRLEGCHGGGQCWAAAHVSGGP
jgi:arylsulfatase A-like enzyme